ncbi:CocE/NonD family hydrolase [Amycolatopsis sp. cmx-11-12]|uniref:CocE/NonD family hydrolase n=1 Tax=Amycolatopsis sp. cmx-11-12 TaxID=2785795 RepID=UPI003918022F
MKATADVVVERDVAVPMRDGTVLRADVHRPRHGGPYPVLVQRTPYGKEVAQTVVYRHPSWYARRGYIVVVQDTRGRFGSAGVFDPFRHEAADGADTVRWAARLAGGTGQVATYGFSYAGAAQLLAAAEQPDGLVCTAPGFTSSDFYEGWTYTGGALNLAFVLSWTLQMLGAQDAVRDGRHADALAVAKAAGELPGAFGRRPLAEFEELRKAGIGYFFDWLEHDTWDEYWQAVSVRTRYDRMAVPQLHFGGWYDTFVEGTLENYARLAGQGAVQRLVIGPWAHVPWSATIGQSDFGEEAHNTMDLAQLEWFEHWLSGRDDEPDSPPVKLFVMGANRWREATAWPPPGTSEQRWFLHSGANRGHGANSVSGDGVLDRHNPGDEQPDVFVSIPAIPVPSLGGRASADASIVPVGPVDQRPVEARNDVLVYTTAPVTEPLEVIGTVWLTLYAAIDTPDADWMVKLVDVFPDGTAVNLCDGALRARFSPDGPVKADEVHTYRIKVGSTAALVAPGHRLRLEIAGSSFPLYDVNPNTGTRPSDASAFEGRPAAQTVFHDSVRASHLTLPVSS